MATFDEFLKEQGINSSTRRDHEGSDVTTYMRGDEGDEHTRRVNRDELNDLRSDYEYSQQQKPAAAAEPAPADRIMGKEASNLNPSPLREPRALTEEEARRVRSRENRRAVLEQAQAQQVFDFQAPQGAALPGGDIVDRLFGKTDVMKGFA